MWNACLHTWNSVSHLILLVINMRNIISNIKYGTLGHFLYYFICDKYHHAYLQVWNQISLMGNRRYLRLFGVDPGYLGRNSVFRLPHTVYSWDSLFLLSHESNVSPKKNKNGETNGVLLLPSAASELLVWTLKSFAQHWVQQLDFLFVFCILKKIKILIIKNKYRE